LALKADHAEAHNNLGNALRQKGNWAEAIASYQNALYHTPDYAEAHLNLGTVLIEQGKSGEAVPHLERALLHNPDLAEAHCAPAPLKEQGKPTRRRLRTALASDPTTPRRGSARLSRSYRSSRTTLRRRRCRREIHALARRLAAGRGQCRKAKVRRQQPTVLLGIPARRCWRALSRFGDLLCPAAAAYWQPDAPEHRVRRAPPARTRMLVVSGHVRQHPVWEIILRGLIEHLDRGRFEIIVYHTGVTCDAETLWARARVDRFVQGRSP
jgi:predicted O-linked N-acetylglucosamine transferase (SPINDLY family)